MPWFSEVKIQIPGTRRLIVWTLAYSSEFWRFKFDHCTYYKWRFESPPRPSDRFLSLYHQPYSNHYWIIISELRLGILVFLIPILLNYQIFAKRKYGGGRSRKNIYIPLLQYLVGVASKYSWAERLPSWPYLLLPQLKTPPSSVRAKLCSNPAAIPAGAIRCFRRDFISVGKNLSSVLVIPSCPLELAPKANIAPLRVDTIEWKP